MLLLQQSCKLEVERYMANRIMRTTSVQTTSKWSTFLALACAVHCVAMPFVGALLPVLGLQFLDSEFFEFSIVGLGLAIGAYSVLRGQRIHRNNMILLLFFTGAATLLSAILFTEEPLEIWLVVAGALMVGIAQWQNSKMTHSCSNPSCTHTH